MQKVTIILKENTQKPILKNVGSRTFKVTIRWKEIDYILGENYLDSALQHEV